MKIYVVVEEYCSDGELSTDVIGAYINKDDAINSMNKADETNMQLPHWSCLKDDELITEHTDTSIFRKMSCDDYYYNIIISSCIVH